MLTNEGYIDRTIRVIIGIALLLVFFICHRYWGLIGLIALATGLFGFCPVYRIFGISSCSTKKKS